MKAEMVRLGDIVEMTRTPLGIDPAIDYQRIGIYSWGKGMMHRDPDTGTEMGKMRYFTFPIPSLIFSNIQAWEGAVALATDAEDGFICSSRFFPYVPKDEAAVSLRYLYEFFRSARGLAIMREASPGTQVRNKVLTRSALEDALVPLPDRATQGRIAAHLDSLAALTATAEDSSSALLNRLVLDAAADAPRMTIGSLVERDRDWIELDDDATYLPVGVSSFGKGMIRYAPVGREGLSIMRYYPLTPGDLLVSNVMAWQGAVAVVEPCDAGRVANNRFLQYRPRSDRVTAAWLASYLGTPEGTAAMAAASHMHSPTNHTLALEAFEAMEVPVPDRRAQDHVAAVAAHVAKIAATSARRDRLAAAILPAARNAAYRTLTRTCDTPTGCVTGSRPNRKCVC